MQQQSTQQQQQGHDDPGKAKPQQKKNRSRAAAAAAAAAAARGPLPLLGSVPAGVRGSLLGVYASSAGFEEACAKVPPYLREQVRGVV
jgi:hypothetical protein